MPTCWIFAGPNGAGKTTFALEYLPKVLKCQNFINADLIAAGLHPIVPESGLFSSARIFLKEIDECIQKGQDFSFETTLAGRSYLKLIRQLKLQGWQVDLIYLALPTVEMSKQRVAERVVHGGHNIPLKDIERRFPRSLYNLLNVFSAEVNHCLCFMNHAKTPELVFEQQGNNRKIIHASYYEALLQEIHK